MVITEAGIKIPTTLITLTVQTLGSQKNITRSINDLFLPNCSLLAEVNSICRECIVGDASAQCHANTNKRKSLLAEVNSIQRSFTDSVHKQS
jgi:hypothetical protein